MVEDSTRIQFWLYSSWEITLFTYFSTSVLTDIKHLVALGAYYHILLIYFYLNFDRNPGRFIQWFTVAVWLHVPLYLLWDLFVLVLFLLIAAWGGLGEITNKQYAIISLVTTAQILVQSVYHSWISNLLEQFREAADQEEFQKADQDADQETEAQL